MIGEKMYGLFERVMPYLEQTHSWLLDKEIKVYKATQMGIRAVSYPVTASAAVVIPYLQEKAIPFYAAFNVGSFCAIWILPTLYTVVPRSFAQKYIRRIWENPYPVYDEVMDLISDKIIEGVQKVDGVMLHVCDTYFAAEDLGTCVCHRVLNKAKSIVRDPEQLVLIQSMIQTNPESTRRIYY